MIDGMERVTGARRIRVRVKVKWITPRTHTHRLTAVHDHSGGWRGMFKMCNSNPH